MYHFITNRLPCKPGPVGGIDIRLNIWYVNAMTILPAKKRKIVVIAPDRKSLALYNSFLSGYKKFSFSPYLSIEDFSRDMPAGHDYVGFIVDLRSILKAGAEAKDSFYRLIEAFPVIRISHTADKQTVKGNIRDKNFKDGELFSYFLNEVCSRFSPRGIRAHKRKKLFLNAYIDFSQNGGDHEPMKSNTADITEDGAFFTSNYEAGNGEKCKVVIRELSDPQPIDCTVKWKLPWGASINHLPGFGVMFNRIAPKQKQELAKLVRHA